MSGLGHLRMLSGAAIWAAHFGAIYGFTALACARGFPALVPSAVAGATLPAAAAAIAVVVAALRTGRGFESWMTAGLATTALLAIVWESLPALMVPPCA